MNTQTVKRWQKLSGILNENSLAVNDIYSHIADKSDGPVTKHVAIYRAIELAYSKKYKPSDIMNNLEEVLEDLKKAGGQFDSNEFERR